MILTCKARGVYYCEDLEKKRPKPSLYNESISFGPRRRTALKRVCESLNYESNTLLKLNDKNKNLKKTQEKKEPFQSTNYIAHFN